MHQVPPSHVPIFYYLKDVFSVSVAAFSAADMLITSVTIEKVASFKLENRVTNW